MATEKQRHFSRYICFKPRCLPDEVKYASKRDEFESTMHWEQEHGNLALCVYATKSNSKGKKNALLLSTMRLFFGVTRDDGKLKPAIIKFYDFTKGGNDAWIRKFQSILVNQSLDVGWNMVQFFFFFDRCHPLERSHIVCDQAW